MPLAPGQRLGSYEVTAAIGRGGMGEVFRARDTKLGRDVAIKVLPAAFAQDPERLARFEREARVLASLNHTNIAHIYGFESALLADGTNLHFLVMEMVEGEDLAARLKRGAVPVDEAIAIARQIAEGLEEAHEQGIVHRDLKPANIKLAPDGKVKVLDFGLAKALEGRGADSAVTEITDSPTVSRHATEAGLIMGTAPYMSPEQARGKALDKRSDIWAFGVVVFEMLTGERLFAGETVTDVLAAVLTHEPDWRKFPAGTPESLRRIVQRSLVRDPRRRLRDLGEVRLLLDEGANSAQTSLHPGGSSPSFERAPMSSATTPRSGLRWLVAGAAAVAGIATAITWGRTPTAAPDMPTHVAINLPAATRLIFGRGSSVALSPDGRRLAYTAAAADKTLLYLQPLDKPTADALPGTDGASNPFFSPDGQWIGFFTDDKLKKVSLSGGAPVEIADIANPRGQFWGSEDSIYVAVDNASGVTRLSARDGSRREAATTLASGDASHRWPVLLSDGKSFLYTVWNSTAWDGSRIMGRKANGDTVEVVAAGGGSPQVLRDPARGRSYLLYARSEGLLVAPFDEARLEVTGPAVPLIDGVVTNLSGGAHYAISPSGTLAFAPGANIDRDRVLAWVTRDGTAALLPSHHGVGRFWSLSNDGRKVARHTVGGGRAIWIDDLDTGNQQRAVVGDNEGSDLFTFPIWTPDQNALVYSQGAPAPNLVYHRLGPQGGPSQLSRSERPQFAMSVSPDGRTLLYQEFGANTASDLWTLPLPSPPADIPAPVQGTPFLNSAASETQGRISPDGRFVTYISNTTGRYEVYVATFPSGAEHIQVSADGGFRPEWAPTGTELLFRTPRGWMMSATFNGQGKPQAGKPRILFDASKYENVFGVAPDGQRFLMMPLLPTEGAATEIRLVLNVLAEIRRRIPE